jgi:hypothetical protein
MNIVLWTLQILLALHTLVGAFWKLTNSEQSIPSLQAMPHGVWLALIALELLCAAGLLLPAVKREFAFLVPIAAAGIAAEMLLFTVLHLRSAEVQNGPMYYWLCVVAICLFIIYGRKVLSPLRSVLHLVQTGN